MYKFGTHILLMLVVLLSGVSSLAQYNDSMPDVLPAPRVNVTEKEQDRFLPIAQPLQIEKRTVPVEKVDELKKDEDYWYANTAPQKKKQESTSATNDKNILNESWFSELLWIVIVVSFIAVVIWYLYSSNIQLFRKQPKKIMEDEEPEVMEDIFLLQYEREINKALLAGNYRLAIRLWYLSTLKELAERNIVLYSHEKTNNEYVTALVGSSYYRDFFRLTRNFEYTWYGQFPLTKESYEFLEKDFKQFKNSLR